MTKDNALTIHNYFCNIYRKNCGNEYTKDGKGIELILFKRLLDRYDKYQLMYIMDKMVRQSVLPTVKSIYDGIDEWVLEYAYDPLIAKARFAINNNKGKKEVIKSLLYDYMDESDAWTPSAKRIEKAAEALRDALVILD